LHLHDVTIALSPAFALIPQAFAFTRYSKTFRSPLEPHRCPGPNRCASLLDDLPAQRVDGPSTGAASLTPPAASWSPSGTIWITGFLGACRAPTAISPKPTAVSRQAS